MGTAGTMWVDPLWRETEGLLIKVQLRMLSIGVQRRSQVGFYGREFSSWERKELLPAGLEGPGVQFDTRQLVLRKYTL